MDSIEVEFITKSIDRFRNLKSKAEKSIKQVNNDEDLFWLPDGESNSIAILVKHITGNMKSRWTNIFEEDGEKADRNRPAEFDQNYKPTRIQLMDRWEEGWSHLFTTLTSLTDQDLMREIYIRKEAHTVVFAIMRQLTHYAEHVGQIIFLAKQIEWKNWKSLSIPREKEVFDYKEL
jgi:hypothetical protein